MAIAHRCDICGNFYEHYSASYEKIKLHSKNVPLEGVNAVGFAYTDRIGIVSRHNFVDTCPDCIDAIVRTIQERIGENDEKPRE